jgi:hypothetical protein
MGKYGSRKDREFKGSPKTPNGTSAFVLIGRERAKTPGADTL